MEDGLDQRVVRACAAYSAERQHLPAPYQGDIHISYLPLAHIYERVVLYTCLHTGSSIGFFRGDVLGLMDDMVALRPTIFVSVPRLLNRIHDKVLAGVREGGIVKRAMFAQAYAAKQRAMAEGRPVSAFWDKLGTVAGAACTVVSSPAGQSLPSFERSWAAACGSSRAALRPLRQRYARPR